MKRFAFTSLVVLVTTMLGGCVYDVSRQHPEMLGEHELPRDAELWHFIELRKHTFGKEYWIGPSPSQFVTDLDEFRKKLDPPGVLPAGTKIKVTHVKKKHVLLVNTRPEWKPLHLFVEFEHPVSGDRVRASMREYTLGFETLNQKRNREHQCLDE